MGKIKLKGECFFMAENEWTGVTSETSFDITFTDRMIPANTKRVNIRYDGLTSGERVALLGDFAAMSKLNALKSTAKETFVNSDWVASTDGEVTNFTRLYFRTLPSQHLVHFDVPDPEEDCFLETGSPTVKPYSVLSAATLPAPEKGLANIIAAILDGSIILTALGEQAGIYSHGERMN